MDTKEQLDKLHKMRGELTRHAVHFTIAWSIADLRQIIRVREWYIKLSFNEPGLYKYTELDARWVEVTDWELSELKAWLEQ